MIEREIIKISIDEKGNINTLRNQFKGWSPISVDDVIKHIQGELYKYYSIFPNLGKIYFHVLIENNIKVLCTDLRKTSRNLLWDLPKYP